MSGTYGAGAYGQTVEDIRSGVTGNAVGNATRVLPASPQGIEVALSNLPVGMPGIWLTFRGSDLYLQAVRSAEGAFFRFDNAEVADAAPLGFDDDYKAMGVDRQGYIKVTLQEVEDALWAIAYAGEADKPGKTQMGKLVVAFCEAARFADIEAHVIAGTRFGGEQLDWKLGSRSAADLKLRKA